MKKIDLHIHTVSTVSDHPFTFSMDCLKKYIEANKVDAIAITNHNLFDRTQYEQIRNSLDIKVFPGIEVDIEGGHLLVITDDDDIEDFAQRCNSIHGMNGSSNTSSISEDTFIGLFPNLGKYLLIPHYDKNPKLELHRIPRLKEYISTGEVSSVKKFLTMKKAASELVPVLFSDLRMAEDTPTGSGRQTYIDIEELTLPAIKYSLMDNAKVSLSSETGHTLFEVLENGLCISTGLTVVLGKRSSGKTHTLDSIADQFNGAKYIRQFSLLSSDDESDQQRFEDLLRTKGSSIAEAYLAPFKEIVDDVASIDLEHDKQDVDTYLKALLQAASEAERQDIFAKCKLFHETRFVEKNLNSLISLIDAVDLLIENVEYRETIDRYISKDSLLRLAISLREQYIKEHEDDLKAHFVNDIVESIQKELQVHSSNTPIPDVDFYQVLMNKERIRKFEAIVKAIKREYTIEEKRLYSYKVVAKTEPFTGAQGLQRINRTRMIFSDAYAEYDHPYSFLQVLKSKEGLPDSDYYKYFVCVKYEVLNQFGTKASGGERSEYNLLQNLIDAARCEILLLDEPESSFDNLFLKDGVNRLLKDLSKQMPVIIATHNNTIGASVHPDYLIYTQKEILPNGNVKYHLYAGYPSSTDLIDLEGNTICKRDVMLDCLEAGEPAYMDRRISYEILGH